MKQIKCAHTCCQATTTDPTADGWDYQDDLHGIGLHNGWWCPESTDGLRQILQKAVASGEAELVSVERITLH
jgi:hypothetical protein